jgi:shikimate dehydrogenase
MKKFGLIGYPLSHSFSKSFFDKKFDRENILDAEYQNYPLEKIEDFPALIENIKDLKGLNVTTPYKESIIPYLTELDDTAKAIGAVNTIKFIDGKLIGYNTDAWGFAKSLLGMAHADMKTAIIIGDGGAAKAVKYVLGRIGISYKTVNRTKKENSLTFEELNDELISSTKLFIQTTPVGTFPNVNEMPPIPMNAINSSHKAIDLIYNPEETLFLKSMKEKGATTKNGSEMLHAQALEAWKIWNNGL